MTHLSTQTGLRVLLLDADPSRAALLRHLLELIPDLRCSVDIHQPVFSLLPEDGSSYSLCFLSVDYSPDALVELVSRIHDGGRGPAVYCLQSDDDLHGDRQETARAVRAGVRGYLSRDELSVRLLRSLLEEVAGSAAAAPDESTRGVQPVLAGSGHWRMDLRNHRAAFDADSLAGLGYGEQDIGDSLGDWKALIHPDDVDRLLRELHQVLDGNAPPHPVHYRIRQGDGRWRQVVSDDISVQLDEQGSPGLISGSFYPAEESATPPTAGATEAPSAAPTAETAPTHRDAAFESSSTAKLLLRSDASGPPRLIDLNSTATLDQHRERSDLLGCAGSELGLDGADFELETALARVSDTGISEAHRVLHDVDSGRWRDYRLDRLDDGTVLVEYEDVTDRVEALEHQRQEQAFWQQVVHSLPDLALILDETGTVSRQLAGGDTPWRQADEDTTTLEDLFGDEGAEQCRDEILRCLNTGKSARFSCLRGDRETGHWLECRLAPLQATPGMGRKVVCTAHDISERIRTIDELTGSRDLYLQTLRRVPLIVALKDADGRYLLVNPHFEAAYGVAEEDIVGKTDYEVFEDDQATALYVNDRKVLESLEPLEQNQWLGDGERRRRFRHFVFPVCGDDGSASGVCTLAIPLDRLPMDRFDADAPVERDVLLAARAIFARVEEALTGSDEATAAREQLERLADATRRAQDVLRHLDSDEPDTGDSIEAAPLARDIVELESLLLPGDTRLDVQLAENLPPLTSSPLAFQQLLLRSMRHAAHQLVEGGELSVWLRRTEISPRGCASCTELVEGPYVELVVAESVSRLSDDELLRLFGVSLRQPSGDDTRDNLAEIHRLVHAQGGHLIVQRGLRAGIALHLLFRIAGNRPDRAATLSSVAPFPRGKS
jgi:PAS domain-containing protein